MANQSIATTRARNEMLPAHVAGRAHHRVAALDGVRGLAILLVYAFHYLGGSSAPGGVMSVLGKIKEAGWSGVDLFFVLSGFLITNILIDTRNDEFRARNFYVRRALRILPIYLAVAAILLALTPLIHAHWRPGHLAFLFYVQNFAGQIDGTLCKPSPYTELTHLWSLAIEEQFYLIWPLLVWRLRLKQLMAVAIAIAVCMPICRVFSEPSVAYFIFRYDGFALGAVLAIGLKLGLRPSRARLAALFGIGFLAIAFDRGTALAVRPPMVTWGISLIELVWLGLMAFTLEPGIATRLLSASWLRFFGRYSYGLYIISGMLLPGFLTVLPRSTRGHIIWFAATLAVNLGLSAASYHLIESRFLGMKDRLTRSSPDSRSGAHPSPSVSKAGV